MGKTNIKRLVLCSMMLIGVVGCSGIAEQAFTGVDVGDVVDVPECLVKCQAIKTAAESTGWEARRASRSEGIYIFSKQLNVDDQTVPVTMRADLAELDNPSAKRLTVHDIDVPIEDGQPDFEQVRDQLIDKGLSATGIDQMIRAVQTLFNTLSTVQT